MANNCLVTKLKESVDNDKLRKLGEIRFKMINPGNFNISAVNDDSFVIEILTPGVTFTTPEFAAGTNKQTVPATGERSFGVNGSCEISVSNKYAVRSISNNYYFDMNVDELSGTQKLYTIRLGAYENHNSGNILKALKGNVNITSIVANSKNIISDLSDLMTSSTLYDLQLNGCDISGDISNLSRLSKLTDFNLSNMTKIYGNVSVFENLSQLRDITFVNSPGITGSISAFANHTRLRSPQLYGTSITGTLSELLVGNTSLKGAYLPVGVTWTDEEAAAADAIMEPNGGSISPSTGHYFSGGTHVDS